MESSLYKFLSKETDRDLLQNVVHSKYMRYLGNHNIIHGPKDNIKTPQTLQQDSIHHPLYERTQKHLFSYTPISTVLNPKSGEIWFKNQVSAHQNISLQLNWAIYSECSVFIERLYIFSNLMTILFIYLQILEEFYVYSTFIFISNKWDRHYQKIKTYLINAVLVKLQMS